MHSGRGTEEKASAGAGRRAVRAWISRWIDIRSGEGRVAILGFAALLFLIITGHTALETARDALLLTGPGPRALGIVYISIALCTFPATALSAAAGRVFGVRRSLVGALLIAAAIATSLSLLAPSPLSAISVYVASGVMASVLVPQFWTLAGMVFTSGQGRRLCGIIAAAGVVGGVAGSGAATAALFLVPPRALPILSAAIFAIAAGVLSRFKSIDGGAAPRRPRPRITASVRALREAPYLVQVAVIVFMSTATLLTFDYLFKSTVARVMPSRDVALFVARFYLVLNLLSLVVQLFVGSALVQRLGTVVAITLTPLLLFLGATATFVTGGAAVVVFAAKAVDGALRYSIHRITGELVYLPVRARLRQRVKPLIDGALARTAQTVTGAALLALGATGVLARGPGDRAGRGVARRRGHDAQAVSRAAPERHVAGRVRRARHVRATRSRERRAAGPAGGESGCNGSGGRHDGPSAAPPKRTHFGAHTPASRPRSSQEGAGHLRSLVAIGLVSACKAAARRSRRVGSHGGRPRSFGKR
jgi:MFS family permease